MFSQESDLLWVFGDDFWNEICFFVELSEDLGTDTSSGRFFGRTVSLF